MREEVEIDSNCVVFVVNSASVGLISIRQVFIILLPGILELPVKGLNGTSNEHKNEQKRVIYRRCVSVNAVKVSPNDVKHSKYE